MANNDGTATPGHELIPLGGILLTLVHTLLCDYCRCGQQPELDCSSAGTTSRKLLIMVRSACQLAVTLPGQDLPAFKSSQAVHALLSTHEKVCPISTEGGVGMGWGLGLGKAYSMETGIAGMGIGAMEIGEMGWG